MLIVEGPDCVGKTTFAKSIRDMAEELHEPLGYTHFGPEMAGSMPHVYLNYYRPRVVVDRYHLSEYVYDRVCREGGAPLANSHLLERTSMALRAIGAVTVLILPTADHYETILESVHCRGELYSIEQCRKVRDEFELAQTMINGHRIILRKNRPFFTQEDVEKILQDYLHVQAIMEKGI